VEAVDGAGVLAGIDHLRAARGYRRIGGVQVDVARA